MGFHFISVQSRGTQLVRTILDVHYQRGVVMRVPNFNTTSD